MTEPSIAERNAQVTAKGNYARWLLRRYQKLDVVELATDLADPISLRQVFVPVHLGEEDLRDEDFGKGVETQKEELPGEDAFRLAHHFRRSGRTGGSLREGIGGCSPPPSRQARRLLQVTRPLWL